MLMIILWCKPLSSKFPVDDPSSKIQHDRLYIQYHWRPGIDLYNKNMFLLQYDHKNIRSLQGFSSYYSVKEWLGLISSNNLPLGQRHKYPPSVLMQAPPWHNFGFRLHSLTSSQVFPSFDSIMPLEQPPQSEVWLQLMNLFNVYN